MKRGLQKVLPKIFLTPLFITYHVQQGCQTICKNSRNSICLYDFDFPLKTEKKIAMATEKCQS